MITLPHSGLIVPNDDFRVSSLKQLETHDGVAFTGTLRWQGKIVGTIENQGTGGGTWARIHDATADAVLTSWVSAARYEDRDAGGEEVMDDLISEYDWGKQIKAAEKKNGTALRLMVAEAELEGMRPYPYTFIIWSAPVTDANKERVLARLGDGGGNPPADARLWWQVWNGEAWDNLGN